MGLRLLIADDNRVQIDSILCYIDMEKFNITDVEVAENGEDCLKIMETFSPDIIITDIEMPRMDGIELAQRVVKESKNTELIFITCHENFEYACKAVNIGVRAYILKPIDRLELEDAITRAVDSITLKKEISSYKNECIEKQQQIESELEVDSESSVKLDVLTICDEMSKFISDKRVDEIIPAFWAKYFEPYMKKDLEYTIYMCYSMINALQCLAKMKGEDLEVLFGARAMWDKIASFKNKEDAVNWLSNLMRMVIIHLVEVDDSIYRKLIYDIKTLIDEHLYEIKNVEHIASMLQISSSYAKNTFKKYTGITIFDYLFDARMKEAQKLLKDPYLRIYEIADRLGYKNKAYFSSAFQKYSGLTPSEYRKLGDGNHE